MRVCVQVCVPVCAHICVYLCVRASKHACVRVRVLMHVLPFSRHEQTRPTHTVNAPRLSLLREGRLFTHLEVQWEEGVMRQDAVATGRSDEALSVRRLAVAVALTSQGRRPVQDLL